MSPASVNINIISIMCSGTAITVVEPFMGSQSKRTREGCDYRLQFLLLNVILITVVYIGTRHAKIKHRFTI